jgi:regulator of protease activity HflC (stomatin/prohibitin superfamily)
MKWTTVVTDNFGNQFVPIADATRAVEAAQDSAPSWSGDTGLTLIALTIGLVLIWLIMFRIFFTVEQQTAKIIERFGKFNRIATPGLHLKIPLIEQIAWQADLRIEALNITVETKTIDDVFVAIQASVQYAVMPDKIYESYYKLTDDEAQLKSYVFDVIRSRVPKMRLDDAFAQKDEIAHAVKTEVAEAMLSFGYQIYQVLVTDIEPDQRVKMAMNEINAAQRERMAAAERGEAERILVVKRAEAAKDSAQLSGEGIAAQRKAIVDGLRDSIVEFQEAVPDANSKEVMKIVLMTQYYDALKQMGEGGKVIFANHAPGSVMTIQDQIQAALEAR